MRLPKLLMAGLFAIVACGGDGPSGGNPPPDDPPDDPPADPPVNVAVGNDFFNPATVNITAGRTVLWTWGQGSNEHNVNFTSVGSPGPNSPTQTSGTFERTFATAGTFNYLCGIHGSAMSGVINVAAASGGSGGGGGGGGSGGGGGYGGGGYGN